MNKKTVLETYLEDKDFYRIFKQEQLILDVTEKICKQLKEDNISRSDLARRLNKTKGYISQLLNGARNLTLRTIADIAVAIDCRVVISFVKKDHAETGKFIDFETYNYPLPKNNYRSYYNFKTNADDYQSCTFDSEKIAA
ncbi:MAG: helix-turn-helix transcriptional regulator [Desulfobacterales bacterium]